MRTWWIAKLTGSINIVMLPAGCLAQFYTKHAYKTAIGPYWSYREAMAVLYRWS